MSLNLLEQELSMPNDRAIGWNLSKHIFNIWKMFWTSKNKIWVIILKILKIEYEL